MTENLSDMVYSYCFLLGYNLISLNRNGFPHRH